MARKKTIDELRIEREKAEQDLKLRQENLKKLKAMEAELTHNARTPPSLYSRSNAGTVSFSGRVHRRADRPYPESHLQAIRYHRNAEQREATGRKPERHELSPLLCKDTIIHAPERELRFSRLCQVNCANNK